MLFIDAHRNGYDTEQCGNTMTVQELRDYLNELIEHGNADEKIYLANDGGYTFGSIEYEDMMNCENEEDYIKNYSRYAK